MLSGISKKLIDGDSVMESLNTKNQKIIDGGITESDLAKLEDSKKPPKKEGEPESDEEDDEEDEEGLSKYTGEGEEDVEKREKNAEELMKQRALWKKQQEEEEYARQLLL